MNQGIWQLLEVANGSQFTISKTMETLDLQTQVTKFYQ